MEHFFINQKNDTNVVIGGVKTLSEFSSEQIIIGVIGAQINIIGENLKIARFDENEISIVGKIVTVETESKRAKVGKRAAENKAKSSSSDTVKDEGEKAVKGKRDLISNEGKKTSTGEIDV